MIMRKREKNVENSFHMWGFHILDRWMTLKETKKPLMKYFEDNGMTSVAIYGLGILGRHLYEELRNEDIVISYGIDQRAKDIHDVDLEMKTIEDELPEVDAVVVTPVAFYEIEKAIYRKLGKGTAVISIEDIVDYCCEEW